MTWIVVALGVFCLVGIVLSMWQRQVIGELEQELEDADVEKEKLHDLLAQARRVHVVYDAEVDA